MTWLFALDPIDALVALVARDDDAFPWLQALEDFDVLGIAPAELDPAACGVLPVGRQNESPLSARVLIERSVGQHQGGGRAPELQPGIDGLPDADALGHRAREVQVDLECAVGHLRVDFDDRGAEVLISDAEHRSLAGRYPADVELV